MNRRGFIGSILVLGMAPAIVRASSLMRVRASPLSCAVFEDFCVAAFADPTISLGAILSDLLGPLACMPADLLNEPVAGYVVPTDASRLVHTINNLQRAYRFDLQSEDGVLLVRGLVPTERPTKR